MKMNIRFLGILFLALSVCPSFGFFRMTYEEQCQFLGISSERPASINEKEWLKNGFEKLLLQAENGNADAQCKIGKCYYNGRVVDGDWIEAEKWFCLAANQGHAEAQYRLGLLLRVDDDQLDVALDWISKAAEQGHLGAKEWLSSLTQFSDPDKAQKARDDLYEEVVIPMLEECPDYVDPKLKESYSGRIYSTEQIKSKAEDGDAWAQNVLGVRYRSGDRVIEDYIEAYAWFLISSMNGSENGAENKKEFRAQLSPSQIAAGQQRAKEIQALIERKKAIAESDSDVPLAADIAPSGFGSGLLVKGGYVLTCWHVVDGSERISISLNGKDHVAEIVQKDPALDLAILKVSDVSDGAVLNLSDGVQLGEKIFTLGYPHPDLQGSAVKFTTGSISGLTGVDNSPRYFQISAPLQSGNSGGPLFDEKGNLVGIVAAKLDSVATYKLTGDLPQNVNYAIKADYLVPMLKTVDGLKIEEEKTTEVKLLELIEELKQSAVMIKVY